MAFIAGTYTATLAAAALGQTAEGYKTSHQFSKRLIKGDSYAETPQDAVYQGGEMDIGYTLIEANAAGVQNAFWPYSGTIYTLGTVGRTDVGSGLADQLVLTAVAGTPAAAAPASITFAQTILKEGFPVEMLYGPDLREVPIRQRIYPSSGVFGVVT